MTNDPAINRLSFEYYYNQAADHCPLLPGLLCLSDRFLALRYGWVTITVGALMRR